ncbi:hypothetical protein QOT17_021518 [Balamuthia mandrillaris]
MHQGGSLLGCFLALCCLFALALCENGSITSSLDSDSSSSAVDDGQHTPKEERAVMRREILLMGGSFILTLGFMVYYYVYERKLGTRQLDTATPFQQE